MNVYEMEGFLSGKCLPGDIKVNESNAEYLVRKLNAASELQGELTAALATIEKCREIVGCQASVDLQDWVKQLAAENLTMLRLLTDISELAQTARDEYEAGERSAAVKSVELQDEIYRLNARIAELEPRTVKLPGPYAYLRENNGQIQISIGPERPSDRSGGYATPWFAIYTAAGIKWEAE
ncbi:hypothetical protein [Klebsiella quasipneumoniae]|uniref:hypothetical protein n=1 Tax=Klebsiella quasipneumoniae TaxID=1463165 RepID=UPI0007CCEF1C|nr:hypothetical protein [Klebsiella quasipneumoniae]SAV09332.1 Uncharacterised protein [Klebsiella quasipneumoniae]